MAVKKHLLLFFFPLLLLIGFTSLRIVHQETFQEISLKIFDRYQRMKPRVYQDAPVRFLDIDEASLQKIGQWPWPRTRVAELVTRLAEAGAAVTVLDILFAEPDRTSPQNIIPIWKTYMPELDLLYDPKTMPDHDELFAKAVQQADNVVAGFVFTHIGSSGDPAVKAGFSHSGDDPVPYLPAFSHTITNLPAIEKAAKGNGCFNFLAESDGVLRRVPLAFRYKNRLYPSLAGEALRVAQGASAYVIKTSTGSGEKTFAGDATGITSVKIGKIVAPTDAEARLWLYDTGYRKERVIPVWKIFEKDFDPATVEGMILFLGTSASGLKDLRTTPLNPLASGTEVHVQLAEQMLLQEFLKRPDWAQGAEILFLIGLGLLLILLLPLAGALWSAVIGLICIGAACGFSWHSFTAYHLLIDPVTPSIACLLLYTASSLLQYLHTESEKRHIRGAFSRYVSPALLDRISKHPEHLKLGGEMRDMSIFFADIRDFTPIAEQYSATELTHFMNRYFTPMTDLIMKHGGTIDKYIGDCIMAFWNAPLPDPDHARRASRTALHLLDHLKNWNISMQKEASTLGGKFTPVAVSIGINTGNCCVGNMGSDQRFDYSVLGDDVNLASRLESQSRLYGVDIVLGPNTFEKVRDFACLELDLIRVKGKTKPVQIYTLLGDEGMRQTPEFQNLAPKHRKMLESYRAQDWGMALRYLEDLLRSDRLGLKKLYELYQTRINACLINPPGPEWNGVYTAVTK
jgi:adenylate cyclase